MLEGFVCELLGCLLNGCLLKCTILKNYSCLTYCSLKHMVRVLFKSHISCNNGGALLCTHTLVIVNTADCVCVSKVLCFCCRLKEIEMSEYDATTYDRFSGAVRRQVQSLRIILDSLQVNTSSISTLGVSGRWVEIRTFYWILPCALGAAVCRASQTFSYYDSLREVLFISRLTYSTDNILGYLSV